MAVVSCDTSAFYVKASGSGKCVLCTDPTNPVSITLDKN